MRSRIILMFILCIAGCSKSEDKPVVVAKTEVITPAPPAVVIDAGVLTAPVAIDAGVQRAPGVYAVGDLVYGRWEDDYWYPGKIAKVNGDGTYKVNYTDGDTSPKLAAKRIKPRTISKSGAGGGGKACPSGLDRCGSRCVDMYNDRNNCFGCGRTCPDGHICKGGMCGAP